MSLFAYVGQGYHRFRRYAPRMLRCLKLEAAPVAGPLVAALSIGEMKGVASPERRFLRPSSKWNRHLRAQEKGEIPVFGKWRYSFTSGMLFVPEMSGSLIRAAMVTSSRYWCR